jgi:hypothetical protein
VVRLLAVPSEPPEVWCIDRGCTVVRYSCKDPAKPTLAGSFTMAGTPPSGTDPTGLQFPALVAGKHVWIATPASLEIRDWKSTKVLGRVAERVVCLCERVVAQGAPKATAVWCGGDRGRLNLFQPELHLKPIKQLQLPLQTPVTAVVQMPNLDAGQLSKHNEQNTNSDPAGVACELWVAQGKALTVMIESNDRMADLSSLLESRVCLMQPFGRNLWVDCDGGKLLCFDVISRSLVRSVSVGEGRCSAMQISGNVLWIGGPDGALRILDAETGESLDVLESAHSEAISALAVCTETNGGAAIFAWSGSEDRGLAVWEAHEDRLRKAAPTTGGDEAAQRQLKVLHSLSQPVISPRSHSYSATSTESESGNLPHALALPLTVAPVVSQKSEDEEADAVVSISPRELDFTEQSGDLPPVDFRSSQRKPKKRVLSKLHVAVQSGNVSRVKTALTALLEKKVADSATTTEQILSAALDRRGPNRRTVLHMAALGEEIQIVELLLEKRADISARDKFDLLPIHLATSDAVKELLRKHHLELGVDPELERKVPTAAASKIGHARNRSVALPTAASTTTAASRGKSRKKHSRQKSVGVSAIEGGGTSPRGEVVLLPATNGGEVVQLPATTEGEVVLLPATKGALEEEVLRSPPTKKIENGYTASPRVRLARSGRRNRLSKSATDGSFSPSVLRAAQELEARTLRAAIVLQSWYRMRSARRDLVELKRVREKRKNTFLEMLSTEETYVKNLDVLVNRIRVSMAAQGFRTAVPIISDADLKVLFPASLNMLLAAHQGWLAQLRERDSRWSPTTCVGDLFLELSPYLKMYIVYVSNFELSTLKIRELKKKPGSTFAAQVQAVFTNLGDPTNDLASLLVTPVQRIPRYVMMLKDLLKLTSPQHPDYNNLLKAVKIMTDTTVLVDRKAEDAKNAQKVLEIADSIVDSPVSIVQPNRKVFAGFSTFVFFFSSLSAFFFHPPFVYFCSFPFVFRFFSVGGFFLIQWVKDGPLGLIVAPGDVRPRFVFLFTDVLVLTALGQAAVQKKSEKTAAAADAPKRFQRELSLLQASVQTIKEDPQAETPLFGFVVRCPKLAFLFQAASLAEKSAWMNSIAQVIELRKEGNQSRINASKSGPAPMLPNVPLAPREDMMVLSARSSSVGTPAAVRNMRKASLPSTEPSDELDFGGAAESGARSRSSIKHSEQESEGESDEAARKSGDQ